jgi:hypothetical protein
MTRSLIFLIIGLGIVWVIMDEYYGDKKIISRLVEGIVQ